MEITWSAVRCVRRSRKRSPRYGSDRVTASPPKRDSNSSGVRSWWSNTNFVRSTALKAIASGQKMSGGLHAWDDVNRQAQHPAARPRERGLPRGGRERVRVLGNEAQLAAAGRVGPVRIRTCNIVDDLVGRVSLALWGTPRRPGSPPR